MTTARIYTVTDTSSEEAPRLVRAISRAHAIKHVTRPFRAEVASQDTLVRLLGDGVEVENAGCHDPQEGDA